MRVGKVVDDIRQLVGNTPLLQVTQFDLPAGVRLLAKLEYFNPGGSVKDRIGLWMIRAAEASGKLGPGGTIIEPTAGNTGIGIAVAARGQYRVIFVVPQKFSQEKQELMRALGAEVVNTPTADGMTGAMAKAHELAAQIPGACVLGQFSNPANPLAHYQSTGLELFHQTDGQIDIFVAGVGSGGTFTGTARFLKEKLPRLKAVAVEPVRSVIRGAEPPSHKTEGIGIEHIYPTLDVTLVDEIYEVSDEDAFAMVRELTRREGVLAGSSGGAAFWAALQEAKKAPAGTTVVTIIPDSSERYLSKRIYQEGL
jgi:cysteine synthase A